MTDDDHSLGSGDSLEDRLDEFDADAVDTCSAAEMHERLGLADAYKANAEHARETVREWEARDTFAATLNKHGLTDVIVLRREVGRDVLTPDRLEIIDQLREQETDAPDSLTTLARQLKRDADELRKDLKRLAELDIICFTDDKDLRPVLTHDHVVVEPIY